MNDSIWSSDPFSSFLSFYFYYFYFFLNGHTHDIGEFLGKPGTESEPQLWQHQILNPLHHSRYYSCHPFNSTECQDGVVEFTFLKGTSCQLARSPHFSSLSLMRYPGHTVHLQPHAQDQECSLVSEHPSLLPSARCNIHNHHLAGTPFAFCAMPALALDSSVKTKGWQVWLKSLIEEGREINRAPRSQSPWSWALPQGPGPPSFLDPARILHWHDQQTLSQERCLPSAFPASFNLNLDLLALTHPSLAAPILHIRTRQPPRNPCLAGRFLSSPDPAWLSPCCLLQLAPVFTQFSAEVFTFCCLSQVNISY